MSKALVIKVLQGKNLMAKDQNGLSDPFCTIACGNAKFKTKVVYKTIEPIWNETFVCQPNEQDTEVQVLVWDKDTIGKDFLGLVSFDLQNLPANKEPQWHPLATRPGKKDKIASGEIQVLVEWMDGNSSTSEEIDIKSSVSTSSGSDEKRNPREKKKTFTHPDPKSSSLKNTMSAQPEIHRAAAEGSLTLLSQLIQLGIPVDSKNSVGLTPLQIALHSINGLEAAAFLIEQGADVNVVSAKRNCPLHQAVEHALQFFSRENEVSKTHYRVSKMLIERGSDPNHQNSDGDTPLHFATKFDLRRMSEQLVEHGCDVNIINRNGDTPLSIAISMGADKVIKTMLSYGGFPSTRDIAAAEKAGLGSLFKGKLGIIPYSELSKLTVELNGKSLSCAICNKTEADEAAAKHHLLSCSLNSISSPKSPEDLAATIIALTQQVERLRSEASDLRVKLSKEISRAVTTVSPASDNGISIFLLPRKDWELLFSISNSKTYGKETAIVHEGSFRNAFYFIGTGSVREEKDGKILGVYKQQEIVGELGLLLNGASLADLIANSEPVQVYEIKAASLYELLCVDTTYLAERFFKYIASYLAARLVKFQKSKHEKIDISVEITTQPTEVVHRHDSSLALSSSFPINKRHSSELPDSRPGPGRTQSVTLESQKAAQSSPAVQPTMLQKTKKMTDRSSRTSTTEEDTSDDKYARNLSIQKEDIVIRVYPCAWSKKDWKRERAGDIVIYKEKIELVTKIFAFSSSEIIAVNHITDLKIEKADESVVISTSDQTYTVKLKNYNELSVIIQGIWKGTSNYEGFLLKSSQAFRSSDLLSTMAGSARKSHQQAMQLTPSDWEEILKGSKYLTYAKDEVLVQEGNTYNNIYQINSGKCRIVKTLENELNILGMVERNGVFGEIGFLDGRAASASVIASSQVAVTVIDGRYLANLLKENHGLSGRFHHYISLLIAERLKVAVYHQYESEQERVVKDIVPTSAFSSLPRLKVASLQTSEPLFVATSPEDDTDNSTTPVATSCYKDIASVKTISTYPHMPTKTKRDGSPICDQYHLELLPQSVVLAAVADGCNWGETVRAAANRASKAFVGYLKNHYACIKTIQRAGELILRAFSMAQNAIVKHEKSTGTSTLIGGLLVPMLTSSTCQSEWGFVFGAVGDCKAFIFRNSLQTIEDLTDDNRKGSNNNPSDPGGRLGAFIDAQDPDLRNFTLKYTICHENDIIFLVSDGVHDNLDPYQLGLSPKDIGLNFNTWTEGEPHVMEKEKSIYRNKLLKDMILKLQPREPKTIVEKLLSYCLQTNQKAADWMMSNPSKKLPVNYVDFPGKMDHTTCLCFKVSKL